MVWELVMAFEVEQKYPVADVEELRGRLNDLGWIETRRESHRDAYLNHPCKDFRQTGEALRIRRIDDAGYVTYKGPKLSGDIKAREELEWCLGQDDPDGGRTESLLIQLGFRPVATVTKVRTVFEHRDNRQTIVVMDRVDSLGCFAEIESVVANRTAVEAGRKRVADLATALSLNRSEPRSYLTMLLEG